MNIHVYEYYDTHIHPVNIRIKKLKIYIHTHYPQIFIYNICVYEFFLHPCKLIVIY